VTVTFQSRPRHEGVVNHVFHAGTVAGVQALLDERFVFGLQLNRHGNRLPPIEKRGQDRTDTQSRASQRLYGFSFYGRYNRFVSCLRRPVLTNRYFFITCRLLLAEDRDRFSSCAPILTPGNQI
jgi:hypothetical protein